MRKKIFSLLCIVGLFMLTSISSIASENSYIYPIMPGTEEWAQYNHAERLEMLNIDEEVLRNLSTEELVDVVLKYPHFSDMYYFNGYQEGFECMASQFNGMQELLEREDASVYLTQKLQEIEVARSMEEQEMIANVEAILAQPQIQEHLTSEEQLVVEQSSENGKQRSSVESNLFNDVYNKCIDEQTENNNEERSARMSVSTPDGTPVPVVSYGEVLTPMDKKINQFAQSLESHRSGSLGVPFSYNLFT